MSYRACVHAVIPRPRVTYMTLNTTPAIARKTKLAVVAFVPNKTKPEARVKATTDAGYPSTVKQVQ